MKLSEAAAFLLEARSFQSPRALQEKLGGEVYHEVFARRWLEADESGYVSVTANLGIREAMQAVIEADKDFKKEAAPVCESALPAWRKFAGNQLSEARVELTELGAPNALTSGQPPTAKAVVATVPAGSGAPSAPAAGQNNDAGIGDEVTVAEDGNTYTARVQSRGNDGTVKLTFGGNTRPSRDTFKPAELKVTGRAPTPSAV